MIHLRTGPKNYVSNSTSGTSPEDSKNEIVTTGVAYKEPGDKRHYRKLQTFIDDRSSLSYPNTHGSKTIFCLFPLHFMDQSS